VLRRWAVRHHIGRSGLARASEQVGLCGMLLAAVAMDPLMLWGALVVIVAAAAFPRLPYGRDTAMLMAAGLSLALFGLVAWHVQAGPLAVGCILLGYGAVVVLNRDAPILLLLLVPRLRDLASAMPRSLAAADALLMALGLGLLLACAGLFLLQPPVRDRLTSLSLGQVGLATLAFGLGGEETSFAACVQLLLLALTRLAADLAPGGTARSVAMAGLAGLPPFGVFPGMAPILLATLDRAIWLLPLLCVGIGGLAWAAIRHLPPRQQARPALTLAWVPLAAAMLLGYAMPAALAAWLRLATAVAG
jgi:hydrogenase-4 component F